MILLHYSNRMCTLNHLVIFREWICLPHYSLLNLDSKSAKHTDFDKLTTWTFLHLHSPLCVTQCAAFGLTGLQALHWLFFFLLKAETDRCSAVAIRENEAADLPNYVNSYHNGILHFWSGKLEKATRILYRNYPLQIATKS